MKYVILFNKKLFIKCNTFEEKEKVCLILSNNNIEFKLVTKGISILRRVGRIFWFNIYVNKKHFEKAKILLSQLVL